MAFVKCRDAIDDIWNGMVKLLDRFLFAEATEDQETLQDMLEIILGRDVLLKHLLQTEKEERKHVWSRQIRLDVWAMDEDSVIYDTEVQQKNTPNLPRRLRLYHGLIDSKLMPPGETNYNRLDDVCLIMIMPFDLFGKGRYQYTFRNGGDEIGVRYMNEYEERMLERQEGFAEGRREGERAGLARGEQLGIAKGKSESMKEIICNMKQNGFTLEQIQCATRLSAEELEKLERELK